MDNLWMPSEFELMAEDELITIVPKFRAQKLHFMSGDFGPFEPNMQADVPLWVALQLKRKGKCTVVWPRWLHKDDLEMTLEFEKSNMMEFAELPFHYIEIATLLFASATDDHEDADRARTLMEDVKNLRSQKIRTGIERVLEHTREFPPPPWVKLTNVAAMEINAIRGTFFKAVDKMYEFSKRDPMVASAEQPVAAPSTGASAAPRPAGRRRFAARRTHAADNASVGAAAPVAADEDGWGGAGGGGGGGAADNAAPAAGDFGDDGDEDDGVYGGDEGGAAGRKLRRHR